MLGLVQVFQENWKQLHLRFTEFFLILLSQGKKAYVNFLKAFCLASPKSDSGVDLLMETTF